MTTTPETRVVSPPALIERMCLTYRHDFGLLPITEQDGLRRTMQQIYEHDIAPHIAMLAVAPAAPAPEPVAWRRMNPIGTQSTGVTDTKYHRDLWLREGDDVQPLYPAPPAPVAASAVHPDDIAVDRFAAAMKAKLAKKRAEGRGGWDNPDECTVEHLSYLLVRHIWKGDPVDVGNLAMMLQQRGSQIVLDDEVRAISPVAASAVDVNLLRMAFDAGHHCAETQGTPVHAWQALLDKLPTTPSSDDSKAVRVRALEWEEADHSIPNVLKRWYAKTPVGEYGIIHSSDDNLYYAISTNKLPILINDKAFLTFDQCVRLHDADHDHRVRACLEPGQGWRDISSAPEGVEALITGYQYDDPARGRYYAVATHLNGYWYDDTDDGNDLHAPTHYLPLDALPPPPTAEEGR